MCNVLSEMCIQYNFCRCLCQAVKALITSATVGQGIEYHHIRFQVSIFVSFLSMTDTWHAKCVFIHRGVTVTGEDKDMAYQVNTKRQGTWADSEVEKSLKSILAFYRQAFCKCRFDVEVCVPLCFDLLICCFVRFL